MATRFWSVLLSCGALSVVPGAEGEGDKPKEPLNDLEKKFKDELENATLSGKWRLVDGSKLGREAEDKYSLGAVEKIGKDLWRIEARIQYGDKDLRVPVPVKVYWAGDTPVISITKAGLPGLGTFTARVLFYEGQYTGTWSGGPPAHGGFLSGVILKGEAKGESDPAKKDAKEADPGAKKP